MAGNRARLLVMFLGVAVALTGLLAAGGPAWTQMEERPITLDLKDVQLEDALRLVFKDTPYSFTLAPGLGGRTVTLTLNDVTFSQALRAILGLHGLTYRKAPGDIYEIMLEPDPGLTSTSNPQDEDVIPARMNLYWFGPGGRYELQYLDCRLVAMWFGGRQIASALIPIAAEGGGGGGGGGGRGGGGGIGGGGGGIGGGGGMGGGIGGGGGGIGGGGGGGGIGGGSRGGGGMGGGGMGGGGMGGGGMGGGGGGSSGGGGFGGGGGGGGGMRR